MKKDSIMLKKWRKEIRFMLKSTYPNATEEKIEKYIDKVIKENYINEEVKCHNNYKNFTKISTCADIENFYYSDIKPIATEHGTFFRSDVESPAVLMLTEEKKERKHLKALRDASDKDSFDYEKYDRGQGLRKISMNSYYGASGAPSFIFFNIHCATATTGKGQAIISTATQAFESFISNNAKFANDNECIVFIKNCINFARKNDITGYVDVLPKRETVLKKLVKTYENPETADSNILERILYNCNKNELAVIYYKNNLFKFMKNSSLIRSKIKQLVIGKVNFLNPNQPPNEIKDQLDEVWDIFKICVFYDHMVVDKMYRLKNKKRKSIVVIDTDSNMINLHPFVNFVKDDILHGNFESKTNNEIRYNSISTIIYVLTKLITRIFYKFMKYSNVPKEKRDLLKMKNEYLYLSMLISPGKKNYVGSIEFKEGKWMDYKLDVKGLPIDKISSNAKSSAFFKSIVKEDILESDTINAPEILKKLQNFENDMIESLQKGEVTFLKPARVKESKYYDDPLASQTVRASFIWNEIVDDLQIEPPDSVYIIKLTSNKLSKIESLKETRPDIYERIKERIFESDIKTIRDKGMYVIALPRILEKVPEWIIPFIDVDTIVHDNMKNIIKILKSIELNPISVKSDEAHFSGIVTL